MTPATWASNNDRAQWSVTRGGWEESGSREVACHLASVYASASTCVQAIARLAIGVHSWQLHCLGLRIGGGGGGLHWAMHWALGRLRSC